MQFKRGQNKTDVNRRALRKLTGSLGCCVHKLRPATSEQGGADSWAIRAQPSRNLTLNATLGAGVTAKLLLTSLMR